MCIYSRGSDEGSKLVDQAQDPLQADSMTVPSPNPTTQSNSSEIFDDAVKVEHSSSPKYYNFKSSDAPLPPLPPTPPLLPTPLPSAALPSTSPLSSTSPLLSSPLPPHPRPPARKVVLIGNPGVGKSTILNALGGNFPSGFSKVSGLTRTVTSQDSMISLDQGQIILELFDVPGIDDCPAENGEDPIVKYLQLLQKTLNSGGDFVIIFVIQPSSGRVSPSDFLVMKTVLDSLKQAPKVGWILNRTDRGEMDDYCSPEYGAMVVEKLGKIVQNKNKKIFPSPHPLVLVRHDKSKGFSDQDRYIILNYVLSFKPEPVQSLNMVEQVVRNFFDYAKMAIF